MGVGVRVTAVHEPFAPGTRGELSVRNGEAFQIGRCQPDEAPARMPRAA